jgi:hypothetical protein
MILLSTAYLPPIQYISKFLMDDHILIEHHENFQKQSYRNRCYIYGANGRQCLVVPVKKRHGEKMPINEVEIDFTENWRKNHLKAIESAYRLSPFYEYYADAIEAFYADKVPLLVLWNHQLLKAILNFLGIVASFGFTEDYNHIPDSFADFRQTIHPKDRLNQHDNSFKTVPYLQVFGDRFGFIPNLSIIDLLFSEGPHSLEVLKNSTRQSLPIRPPTND